MKNGIFREDEGFDILINGVPRTFRDVEQNAIESAIFLKGKNKDAVVEIVKRADGSKWLVLPDGRLA